MSKIIFVFLSVLPMACFSSESQNQFQYFDNNITLNYQYTSVENNSNFSTAGLEATALFDNNVWLNAAANTLITYSLDNNNSGLQNLYQNKSGSNFGVRGGYAFVVDNLNLIPHIGFAYSNLLLAYNQNSTQEFIFENPAYTLGLGLTGEYIIVPRKLKFGLDTDLTYSTHKAVLPNSSSSLGHSDYNSLGITLSPSLQYNLTARLTIIGFYSLTGNFSGSTPPNVYYPEINVNSSSVINNDNLANTFGIKFGMLF